LAVLPPGSPLPSGRRLRLADLTEYPSVLGPAGTSACELVEQALGDIGLTPVVAVETTQREAIVPLIMTGAGASAVAGFARR
jgi:DNA-binding transcriptional LysR family regulator